MDEDGTSQDHKQGIKLFGKRITFHERKVKDEDKAEDELRIEKRSEKIIPCPRCKSMETKFCYFNNYNVNQPRHFCKGCQRYWTEGGALRNVPVGAGRRKTKPLCRNSIIGLPERCVYDPSSAAIHKFQFDGVMEDWKVISGHGSFQQAFPVKRRRDGHGGCSPTMSCQQLQNA